MLIQRWVCANLKGANSEMGVCANLKGANSEKCETPLIKGEPLGGKELKFTCVHYKAMTSYQ